jgi:iron complex outermembrane receptor protein
LSAAAVALIAPEIAAAQEVDPSEIIVTARKREESILQVPVVTTVLSQEQLGRFQTRDLKDLATKIPGLQLGEQPATIGTQVALRGVGTSAIDAGIDQSVSLNIDGLPLGQGIAYRGAMFDVGQVEVLKGPQALFYGKSSPGGVIAIRTADPSDRTELIARYGYEGRAHQHVGELIASGPVTDTLKLRLAGLYDHADGYLRNLAVGAPQYGGKTPRHRRSAESENIVVRGTALWDPAENFRARLKLSYVKTLSEGGNQQLASCPDGKGAVPGFGIQFINPDDDCRLNRRLWMVDMDPAAFVGVRNGGTPFVDSIQKYGTLELNYDPSPQLSLNSTTAYYRLKTDSLINGNITGFAGPGLAADNHYTRRQFTQEIRLNSEFSGPLNFTLGGFYEDGRLQNTIRVLGNTAIGRPATIVSGQHIVKIETLSAFGQLRFQVIPRLEIAAGARWSSETRKNTPYSLATGVPVLTVTPHPKLDSDNFSPELTVTYRPTDDLTIFGALKKGYKSGSFSITTPAATGQDNSFGDENVKGGEIGLKSRLFDRQLSFNIAAYYYKYRGLQVGANQEQGGIPVLRTLNAGAARVYGVEADASFRPAQVEGLELHAAVNWNKAEFTRLEQVPCWGGQTVAEGCNQGFNPLTERFTGQDLSGEPLVRAPRWQANFGFSKQWSLTDALDLIFSNDNVYASKYKANLGLRDDYLRKGYFKADVALTLKASDNRWEFALIGKNVTDRYTATTCSPINVANGTVLGGAITGGTTRGPSGIDELTCFADRGREIWVRLTLRPFD